jgi:hypothetical protein
MPNGADKSFVRLCAAIEGFRIRYGRWPQRVVAPAYIIEDIRDGILAPGQFERLEAKVRLVPGNAGVRAEDDAGGFYEYGKEGFSKEKPDLRAWEWLDVELRDDLH